MYHINFPRLFVECIMVILDPEYYGRVNDSNVFFRKGFGGQDCVLRAICENAQYPLEDEGLVGEILHILLT